MELPNRGTVRPAVEQMETLLSPVFCGKTDSAHESLLIAFNCIVARPRAYS